VYSYNLKKKEQAACSGTTIEDNIQNMEIRGTITGKTMMMRNICFDHTTPRNRRKIIVINTVTHNCYYMYSSSKPVSDEEDELKLITTKVVFIPGTRVEVNG